MYEWLVYLHILSVLLFMGAHGVSIMAAFRLRAGASREQATALLDASRASLAAMYGAFAVLLLSGITLGIIGDWWRTGWFWGAILVFVAIFGSMVPLGVKPFSRIRQYAGLTYADRGKWLPAQAPDDAKMAAETQALKPGLLAAIALGGLAIVLWLMMFKPF